MMEKEKKTPVRTNAEDMYERQTKGKPNGPASWKIPQSYLSVYWGFQKALVDSGVGE